MKTVFVLLMGVFLLTSCTRTSEHKYTLYIFGTLVEFTIFDADKQTADKAVAQISSGFQEMHQDWHAWKPGKLTALNTAIHTGKPSKIDPDMEEILEQARQFERLSDGLFNPTMGGIVALWGFHADDKPKGPPPDRVKIAHLVAAHPSMNDVEIKNGHLSSRNKAVQFDFGGFAKGSALDWAAEILKKNGIENAILNAGGDLNVIGRHGKRPWRIGIHHPKHWGVIASVELGPDEVLYTSGNYHRYREHEGLRYSHIIDPRTGWPVEHIVSSSVIHKKGALADAAATALSVAGPKSWLKIAVSMGIDQVLLVDKNGGLYMTPKMQKRLKLETNDSPIIEIRDPGGDE